MKSKAEKIVHFDAMAAGRDAWRRKNRYYYDAIESLFRDLIPRQRSVIEIGCGTGELLAALQPHRGLGIDFSKNMIDLARARFSPESNPQLEFCVGDAENLELDEPFDYVVMS